MFGNPQFIRDAITTASFLVQACAFAVTLAGCADTRPTQTGFLTQYDQIRTSEATNADPSYSKPGLSAGQYTGFIVDPVVYRTGPGAPALDAETVQELTSDYRTKLISAFSSRLRPAAGPGPGVLRVRAAITTAERANPVVNVVTIAAIFVPVTTGGASTEAEVVDSVTGERLVALTAYNNGGRSFLGGPFGFLSQYGHARRAFTVQADKLRDLVSQPAGAVQASL